MARASIAARSRPSSFTVSASATCVATSSIRSSSADRCDAHVSDAGNADYLALRNVDWRSATDSSYFTTEFKQASLTWDQDIGDQLDLCEARFTR